MLAEARCIRIRGSRESNYEFTAESEEEIALFAAQTACIMRRRGNRQLDVRTSCGKNEGVSLNNNRLKRISREYGIDARVEDLGILLR